MHALEARLRTAGQPLFGSGIVDGAGAVEAPGGDAGVATHPTPVPGVNYAGAEEARNARANDLDPAQREGLGRPQLHRIAMSEAEQYRDEHGLTGEHGEIAHVTRVPRETQLPWEPSAETSWREVPARDAGNPAPGGCQ